MQPVFKPPAGAPGPYDGKIHANALEAALTQVDHVVAQSWTKSAQMLSEWVHADEDLCNVLMTESMQNSTKSARVVRFISDDARNPRKQDHSWFSPDADLFTNNRHGIVARRVLYMFMSYPLLRQHDNSGNPLAGKGGCTYYANIKDHLLAVTASEAVHAVPHAVVQPAHRIADAPFRRSPQRA